MTEQTTNNSTKAVKDVMLAVRLTNLTKEDIDKFLGGTRAKSRNGLANVLLRFGIQRLPTVLRDVEQLYRLLQEVATEQPELVDSSRQKLGITNLAQIDESMAFLKKLKDYIAPSNSQPEEISLEDEC